MPKTVEGGTVYRQHQNASMATDVEKIDFPAVAQNGNVALGAVGTMVLKSPPPQIGHYDQGDILFYQDSNHNNDRRLQVTANNGPSKYGVIVI